MSRYSLRLRLVLGGLVAILIAIAVAGGALVLLFERHVARSLAEDLDIHLKQLLAGIDVDAAQHLVVTRPPADPRFADPLSGLYWQVSDRRGEMLRSRSLWDAAMTLPADELAPGEVHHHQADGPAGGRMLVAERAVRLTVGGAPMPVRVAVAADLGRVRTATVAYARDLTVALGLLAVVLALATSAQVALGLRPLDALRRGIADIRAGRTRTLPAAVPTEVRPLVDDFNALLEAQEREIERSRSRAADLAHGLKTPLAALAADAARLREHGEFAIADDVQAVGEAMSRHVDRELARARARGGRAVASATEVAPLVRAIVATLARTPDGARIVFETDIGSAVRVPLDRADLAEVLGNLLENAARHAATRVRASAADGSAIAVEDDGAGIAPAQIGRVLARGGRLDERGDGAGLGLAIVQDVLHEYGWALALDRSDLGGLRATLAPAADAAPDRAGHQPALSRLTTC